MIDRRARHLRTPVGVVDLRRRLLAGIALATFALALVAMALGVARNLFRVGIDLVALTIAVMSAWVAATRRGVLRLVAALVAAAGLTLVVVDLVVDAELGRLAIIVALAVTSTAAGRAALGQDRASLRRATVPGRPVGPAERPVLLINERSGGGKAGSADVAGHARSRGIEVVVVGPEDDLLACAKDAVARGADALGMAGGDGSQAVVASVAAAHDVAFVCVPAGTRNHFALDLGLDRDDLLGALDAFGPAVERRIDLGSVNGYPFVNNVSLGVYAKVVQSDTYRDSKLATALDLLPDLLGPDAPPFDLQFIGPDGAAHRTAHVIQVSNNPYDLHTFSGTGSRPRLDGHELGIVTVRIDRPSDVPTLLALGRVGGSDRYPGFLEWTAPEFRVDSGGPVEAGVDGEALVFDPPLSFRCHPDALRVRVPRHAPGYAPAALAIPAHVRVVGLTRLLFGRMR